MDVGGGAAGITYDTFQANLAELKINKTFVALENAKIKWASEKEGAREGEMERATGEGKKKFRAVK
jgi:hypothetical protein